MKLRDEKGKYTKKPNWLRRTIVLVMVILLVAVVFIAKPQEAPVEAPQQNIEQVVELRTKEAIGAKIERLEDELLTQLSVGCETRNVEDPDGAIIYDTAAKGDRRRMSIGRFMFQRRTIKHYIQMRDGKDITNAEAIAIAIDPVQSTELARYVIFDLGELKQNWFNCTNKHDLDTQVRLINKLK